MPSAAIWLLKLEREFVRGVRQYMGGRGHALPRTSSISWSDFHVLTPIPPQDLAPGAYKLERFCMEPTRFDVKDPGKRLGPSALALFRSCCVIRPSAQLFASPRAQTLVSLHIVLLRALQPSVTRLFTSQPRW